MKKPEEQDTPVIRVENLRKSFGELEVLCGLDLDVHPGKTTTIIGKSGSGKSVLLKCMAGLLQPDSGKIFFRGEDLHDPGNSNAKEIFQRKLSYMFQNNALFDSYTIEHNIGLPLREKTKMPLKKICARILEFIEKLDLDKDILEKYPSQISGGMQKRVALARALITDPDIVLFDEPTTGLDPVRKNTVYEMISKYQERFGFTSLIVSHDIPDVLCISDTIAILDEGRFQFTGKPEQLKETRAPFKGQDDKMGFYNPYKNKIMTYFT